MLNIGLEQQQQIRGADGSILWTGGNVLANTFIVQVAAGGTTIKIQDAVQWDATNSNIARHDFTNPPPANPTYPAVELPMSLAMFGVISPSSANAVNLIGVAQEPIAAGKRGLLAGSGSLVCVASTATTLAIGAFVGSSATAGAVALVAAGVGTNIVLGAVFKINTVATPGTGSTTAVGILIKGGSVALS
jgi:hypothetical protein